jgi:hypothetical protein
MCIGPRSCDIVPWKLQEESRPAKPQLAATLDHSIEQQGDRENDQTAEDQGVVLYSTAVSRLRKAIAGG